MSKARVVEWRSATAAPIVFISGNEEYLTARSIRSIRDDLRAKDVALEVHEIDANDYSAGQLINLASPSLFGEPRLVVIRGLEKCTDELITDGIAYLDDASEDVTVIFTHSGATVRGKKLVDAIRANSNAIEISCVKISKEQDKIAFVNAEIKAAGRQINTAAVRALLDAFSDDLAELAAACNQLCFDSTQTITEELVDKYYGGRVETTAFKVADAALAGQTGEAMALLRHTLSSGSDPVPIVAALAMKIRQMAKLFGNRTATPQSLGMQPWQLDKARRDLAGWNEDGLAAVIQSLVQADAAAKGAERDGVFALEKLVRLISTKGAQA